MTSTCCTWLVKSFIHIRKSLSISFGYFAHKLNILSKAPANKMKCVETQSSDKILTRLSCKCVLIKPIKADNVCFNQRLYKLLWQSKLCVLPSISLLDSWFISLNDVACISHDTTINQLVEGEIFGCVNPLTYLFLDLLTCIATISYLSMIHKDAIIESKWPHSIKLITRFWNAI